MQRRVAACLMLGGCAGPVEMVGRVEVAPDESIALPEVALQVRDGSNALVAETRTDAQGRFSVEVPRGEVIQVIVDPAGPRPSAFQGESGLADRFEVPDGTLFAVPDAWLEAFTEPFEGCEGARDGGGLILGYTALDVAVSPGVQRPPEQCGFAFAERDGERIDACYLAEVEDAEGVFAWDPDVGVTGPTGRFVIPGVSGGPWRVVVGRYQGCDPSGGSSSLINERIVYLPEDGVSVRLPALVPL